MIKLENVSFNYERNIIKNANIEIHPDKITFIIGKNGSGKSTLANIIAGLHKIKNGSLYIDNTLISKKISLVEMRKKVGIVFQNPDNQIIFSRVYDDIKFTLENLHYSKEEIDEKIKNSLKEIEMEDYIEANPYNLSLGQKQRIAIASMLAINPSYMIFDEATSMLDINGKQAIYKIINNLHKKGVGIIFITNIMDELLYADEIIIIDNCEIYKYSKEFIIENLNILKEHGLNVPLQLKLASILRKKGKKINNAEDIIKEVEKL